MRPLGISMKGANVSPGLVNIIRNSTMAELVYEWNVWETQTMVFISFMLQLFLLATGSLHRRKTNLVLKALIWLAYVGADLVAVYGYALGLFSQYEDRYKLGRESHGYTLPFLWVPFLLVHLGGQDSITAFSLEDNNLWLRHLLNLASQGFLALYVFWKSFHRINYSILTPAMFVFVSGIMKYGERVWALKSASRNGLGQSVKLKSPPGQNNVDEVYPSRESYALQMVLLARGLFVGRNVLQLGDNASKELKKYGFQKKYKDRKNADDGPEDCKLKVVVMELGMMFDLLYTKANVLQRWTGVLFRCASQTLMVVAFLLFLICEKAAHNHNRVNVAITYTLFTGAMFMEAYSIAVVMASPWTRAHLKEGRYLHVLCNFATSLFKAVQCNKKHRRTSSSTSMGMGQFNLMDYCIAMKYKPRIMSKAISAIGLDKQWRNLCYVHHIDDASRAGEGIISGVMQILGRPTGEWFGEKCLGRKLNFILSHPFEHALYRLHLYTELHICRHFAQANSNGIPATDVIDESTMRLKEECETLSNYMMYLMLMRPSMLPVSTAAGDLEPKLLKEVSNSINGHEGAWTKLNFLEKYTSSFPPNQNKLDSELFGSPFGPEPGSPWGPYELKQSLEHIKEMWLRLLMYAAGKCSGEVHARQLGEGGELITFVWLNMVHLGIGDVGEDLALFTSNDPVIGQPGSKVSDGYHGWRLRQREPTWYAFDFRAREFSEAATQSKSDEQEVVMTALKNIVRLLQRSKVGLSVEESIQVIAHQFQYILSSRKQKLSAQTQQDGAMAAPGGASEQGEARTSGHVVTPSEFHEQAAVMTALKNEQTEIVEVLRERDRQSLQLLVEQIVQQCSNAGLSVEEIIRKTGRQVQQLLSA